MKPTVQLLLAATVVVGLLSACQHPSKKGREFVSDPNAPAARHAVYNQQLKGIMERLAMLPAERLPQELDVVREQRWRRDDAVRILAAMAASADAIPTVLTSVELPDEHRRAFRDMSEGLKRAAEALQADAPKLTPEEIGRRFDALQVHCHACHSRFRILPVLE